MWNRQCTEPLSFLKRGSWLSDHMELHVVDVGRAPEVDVTSVFKCKNRQKCHHLDSTASALALRAATTPTRFMANGSVFL